MPYSRPWGVLFSIVKHTSFPISFFRRNSRAGNAQGWKTEPSPSGARLFSHCTINTQATSPLQQPGNKLGPEEKAKMKCTAQLTHLEGSWNEGLIVGATCASPKDRHHAIPGTSTRTFPTSIAIQNYSLLLTWWQALVRDQLDKSDSFLSPVEDPDTGLSHTSTAGTNTAPMWF